MTQTLIGFPQSLTDKYRPHTIEGFAGLEKPKKVLLKFSQNPRSIPFAFIGPPGTGKTAMALALGEQMGWEVHHIPSQQCNVANVEEVIRMCHYVPRAGGKAFHLVLVDEADRMSPAAQLHFLSKLDATGFPPSTVFVFTMNSTDGLDARFLSRCLKLEFSSYGLAKDAADLLESIWNKETGNSAPNFAQIVRETRNNVRDALMSLETELLAA